MIFYKTDGTAEIGRKICNCKNHVEPHWLYLINKEKKLNESFTSADRIIRDLNTLKNFHKEMEKRGILEIFRG